MRTTSTCNAAVGVILLASAHSAAAHGIAGNRFFVGTLTFDDPSVADEAILPNFSTLNSPVEGGNATDNRFDWSFTRLLTPFLQVQRRVSGPSANFRLNVSHTPLSASDILSMASGSNPRPDRNGRIVIFAPRPRGAPHRDCISGPFGWGGVPRDFRKAQALRGFFEVENFGVVWGVSAKRGLLYKQRWARAESSAPYIVAN
jgi:hypothetical protein